MVKAWYMDDETSDQRLEHHRTPPEYLSLEELYKKTGVEYFNVSSVQRFYMTLPTLLSPPGCSRGLISLGRIANHCS